MADLTKTVSIIFQGEDRAGGVAAGLARDLDQMGNEASQAASKVDQLDSELDSLGKRGPGLSAVTTAIQALAASLVVQAFIDSNVAAEQFTRTMTLLKGSSAEAAQELEYVKRVSNQLGLEVGTTARAYTDLTAATKGTTLEGRETRTIFEAIAKAMAALGKSSEDTNGAFLAVTQIVSKGRVSLEELTGQLGERLPGALQIAARGLGLTTAELTKLVEDGGLRAERFLPAFAAELEKTFAGASFDGYTQQLARLRNSINDAFVLIGDAGAFRLLTSAIDTAGRSVAATVGGLQYFGNVFGAVRKLIETRDYTAFERDLGIIETEFNLLSDKISGTANESAAETARLSRQAAAAGAEIGSKVAEGADKSSEAWKKASAEIDKSLKALGVDPKLFVNPVKELETAFKDLASNSKASGEQIVTGLIGALQQLPRDASLKDFLTQAALAFRDGRLNAEQYAQAVALIETKQKNLSPSFGPVSDAARKQAEELRKNAEATKKAAEETDKYKLELEKLASNERIKNIESKVKLDIAQLEADTKKAEALFASLDNTVNSTGDLLGDLFGLFKDFDSMSFGAIRVIEKQIELENKRRQDALDLQKKLSEAQINEIRSRTKAIERGDSLIKVDGAGLQPHLEAFMWEILRTIQVRVNADGLKMLTGA
jgi:tape measure domain-containing protein